MRNENYKEIGNTSIKEVKGILPPSYRLFAKCEFENPSGSHKDRVYKAIIENLEKKNILKKGMTLIDFTSGNGGAALAQLGKQKKYRVKIVIPSQESPDKIRQIQKLGGDVIFIQSDAKLGYINSEDLLKARLKAGKIAEEKGYIFVDQANNPFNREGCKKIGEEIVDYIKQNDISPDAFICGIGTGGTISGVAEILKENFPNTKVIGVEPYESNTVQANILKNTPRHLGHNLSGLGMGAISGNMVLEYIDDIILVEQIEWTDMMDKLREKGVAAGKSSAACVVAAQKLILKEKSCRNILTIFFDLANKYETENCTKTEVPFLSDATDIDISYSKTRALFCGTVDSRISLKKYGEVPCIDNLLSDLSQRGISKVNLIPYRDNGFGSYLAENGIEIIGYDNNSNMLKLSNPSSNTRLFNHCRGEIKDILNGHLGYFEVVISFDFSQFLPDEHLLLFLDNIYKSLPMGGLLYITFFSSKCSEGLFGVDRQKFNDNLNITGFIKYRKREEIIDLISFSGFSIKQLLEIKFNEMNGICCLRKGQCTTEETSCYFGLLEKAFHNVNDCVDAIKVGKPIIVLDHREDEGDLYIASEKATSENINFLLNGRGILCISMLRERMNELKITSATELLMNLNDTRFGMAIDYLPGIVSGVSTTDRAATVRSITLSHIQASDILKNGHVRTLEAMQGGLHERQGHCEASVDLARLAGLYPSGATCELLNKDGEMMREEGLIVFSRDHQIPIIKINQIFRYQKSNV